MASVTAGYMTLNISKQRKQNASLNTKLIVAKSVTIILAIIGTAIVLCAD
jgi:hypothetical protein